MDSGSSSTTQSQQTTQQSTSDNRIVLGQSAMLAKDGSSINITTLDADVAKAAMTAGTKNLEIAASFAKTAQSQVLDSLSSQTDLVKDAYSEAKGRGALTDKILIGAIAMSGLVAIAALRK